MLLALSPRTLGLAAAVLGLVALAPTGNAGPSCPVPGTIAAYVPGAEDVIPILEDHYLRYTQQGNTKYVQLWRETNGLSGLQPTEYRCPAGDVWAPDTHRYSIPLATGSLPI